jgi:DNA-directed RNA polymerase subunit RPC12/RpoP
MKGKTTCPNCENEFIMDILEDKLTHRIQCPQCKHLFSIKRKCDTNTDDCGWEEYGEPRKTILSAMRKKTNRPLIVSFLLLATGILGIFTATLFLSEEIFMMAEFEFIAIYFQSLGNIFFSIPLFIFSIFAIAGSITAFKRRFFLFTFLCSVIGIFSIGFIVGTILSIIAVILLFMSQDDFTNGAQGKEF